MASLMQKCQLFTKISEVPEECEYININIRKSKYGEIFEAMNSAVVLTMGPSFQLNWRWLDLNLFLSELKLHEFGTIDWYEHINTESTDSRRNLATIKIKYLSLSPNEKLNILRRSVIEAQDAFLAVHANNAGIDKEESGDIEGAEKEYQKALKLDPHALIAVYHYADMLSKQGKSSLADRLLDKLLMLDPENAKGLGIRAMIREEEGKLSEAVNRYKKACSIDNTSATRLRNYAMLLMEANNYTRAKSVYEETIALDKSNGMVIGEYADLLHTMNLFSEAEVAFERAIATGNANNTVINDYAGLLYKIAMETGDQAALLKAKELINNKGNPLTPREVSTNETNKSAINREGLLTTCAACRNADKFTCGTCKNVKYCSRECQESHWPIHKKRCVKWKKDRKCVKEPTIDQKRSNFFIQKDADPTKNREPFSVSTIEQFGAAVPEIDICSKIDYEASSEISLLGIKLSYLFSYFLPKTAGMTTQNVCDTIVKPVTASDKCSFCQYQQRVNPSVISKANVFISHAWQYNFGYVMETLKDYFEETPDIFIWFDVMSNNQHEATNRTFEWWINSFKSAIKEIGRTVMVLTPYNDPIPLTRGWCIWELYCTIDTQTTFEVAMSSASEEAFINDVESNPTDAINSMIAKIHCDRSKCSEENDQVQIHTAIMQTVGFTALDARIFERMRNWIIDKYTKEHDFRKLRLGLDDPLTLKSQHCLASLYSHQGKTELAASLMEDVGKRMRSKFGPNDPRTLSTMCDLSRVYFDQRKFEKAERLAEDCLKRLRERLGSSDVQTLEGIFNLAMIYTGQGSSKLLLAPPLYEECLKKRKELLGSDHADTLTTMSDLALVDMRMGKYIQAEPLMMQCLDKRKLKFGSNHPDTLLSINNLALLSVYQGKYEFGEILYKEVYSKEIAAHGTDHPSTLITMHNLGYLYSHWGKYEDAERLLVECVRKRSSLFGRYHFDTMESLTALVLLFDTQGKHTEREPWLKQYHKGKIIELTNLGVKSASKITKDEVLGAARRYAEVLKNRHNMDFQSFVQKGNEVWDFLKRYS
jgi:tetratricopeptide (TPR) repeat protein